MLYICYESYPSTPPPNSSAADLCFDRIRQIFVVTKKSLILNLTKIGIVKYFYMFYVWTVKTFYHSSRIRLQSFQTGSAKRGTGPNRIHNTAIQPIGRLEYHNDQQTPESSFSVCLGHKLIIQIDQQSTLFLSWPTFPPSGKWGDFFECRKFVQSINYILFQIFSNNWI